MPELTQCPQCQRKLNVQESQLGMTVQCPVCGEEFPAAVVTVQRTPSRPPPAPPEERESRRPDLPPRGRDYDDRRPRARDDDYDDRGRRPRGRGYSDYRDPYGAGRPHRGGAVLALGLVGLCLSCVPLVGAIMGGVALSMANTDLPQMTRGTMDDSGKGLTQGGQVCGIIAIVLNCLVNLCVCSGGFSDALRNM